MIEQLLKGRLVVEPIVIDFEWTTFVKTLHNTHQHRSLTRVKYVQANIKD
jgi:hypothetical protein